MVEQIPYSILIIEDNDGDFFLIKECLNEAFPQAQTLHKKRLGEAVECLVDQIFDLILLDLTLPDSVGMESIKQIIAVAHSTPVIVLTGYSDKDFGISTLSMGVSDYLLKDEINVTHLQKCVIYSIERKKIEAKLVESEEKYRSLFHLSPIPKWVYDLETLRFLNINEAAIENYGFSREEFLTMYLQDIWPKEDEEALDPYEILNNDGSSLFKHLKKNGERIFVKIHSNPIVFEGRKSRLVIATDITEELKSKEKIIKYNQQLKSAQEIGHLGYWEFDLQTLQLFWSEEAYRILGIEDHSLEANYEFFLQLIHPDDLHIIENIRKTALEGLASNEIEHRIVRSDGTIKHVYQRGELIYNDQKKPIRFEAVIQDVTERKNYVEEIEYQNTQLRDIAWTQSHIVRAPLARLMGVIHLIKDGAYSHDDYSELLDYILVSAQELDNIIREIVKKTNNLKQHPIT